MRPQLRELLDRLLALGSVLALFAAAALPPLSADAAPLAAVLAQASPLPQTDHQDDRLARSSSSAAAPVDSRAKQQFSRFESYAQCPVEFAGAAHHGMPETAARVTDGRGLQVSKQSTALARFADGVKFAPLRSLL